MHSHNTLLEGDVATHLHRLALPLMWGMFAMTAASVIDALYISRLGTTALAALGFTIPMASFFMGILFGLTVGITSALSRTHGQGDGEKAQQLAVDALVMTSIVAVAASVIGYFLIDHLFRRMGASEEVMPLIHRYMAIWYCGMIFMGLILSGNACIRATGDTRFPSMIMTLVAALNICLDPFLIFGWGPFPRMGVAGAAATFVITNIIVCAISMYFLISRKNILKGKLFHAGTFAAWKTLLHVGIPSILTNLITPLSAAAVTWMVSALGKEAVAAFGVAMRIEGLSVLVFFSLGAGVAIFTGQNYGAGNYGRVSEVSRIAEKYALLWSVVIAAVLWIFANEIPLLFDHHPMVVSYTAQYLHIVPISYGAMAVVIISNASMNGMGKPLPATFLILLRALVLYVPLAYVGSRYFGFTGILVAMAFTNIIVGIISYLWNKIVTP